MSRPERRKFLLPGVAICLAAAVAVQTARGCRPSLEESSFRVADAVSECDGKVLMRHAHPLEVERLGLTAQKLEAVCRLVAPEGWSQAVVGDDLQEPTFGGGAIDTTRTYRTKEGYAFPVSIPVHDTEAGPSSFVLWPLLSVGFGLRYADRYPHLSLGNRAWSCIRDGLSEFRPELERLGLPGAMDERLELLSWADLARAAEEWGRAPSESAALTSDPAGG